MNNEIQNNDWMLDPSSLTKEEQEKVIKEVSLQMGLLAELLYSLTFASGANAELAPGDYDAKKLVEANRALLIEARSSVRSAMFKLQQVKFASVNN